MIKILLVRILLLLIVFSALFYFAFSSRKIDIGKIASGISGGGLTMGSEDSQRTVMVIATEYSFSPSLITVGEGEKIRLIFRNRGKVNHSLTIDELNIATPAIAPGQWDEIDLKIDQVGTYTFYCSESNYRELGMEGKIKVIKDN